MYVLSTYVIPLSKMFIPYVVLVKIKNRLNTIWFKNIMLLVYIHTNF